MGRGGGGEVGEARLKEEAQKRTRRRGRELTQEERGRGGEGERAKSFPCYKDIEGWGLEGKGAGHIFKKADPQ